MDHEIRMLRRGGLGQSREGPGLGIVAGLQRCALDAAARVAEHKDALRIGHDVGDRRHDLRGEPMTRAIGDVGCLGALRFIAKAQERVLGARRKRQGTDERKGIAGRGARRQADVARRLVRVGDQEGTAEFCLPQDGAHLRAAARHIFDPAEAMLVWIGAAAAGRKSANAASANRMGRFIAATMAVDFAATIAGMMTLMQAANCRGSRKARGGAVWPCRSARGRHPSRHRRRNPCGPRRRGR